ncbi:ABC transporter permease [Streptomyces sp. NPDC048489]|uniref:ABC transporter permease n=1 Tax=Streptomyces sp. NPDC048489 TaxID=3154504 RepID=UPI0034153F0B
MANGDLGRTVTGGQVNEEFTRRVGVSTRLLLIATVVGSVGGVLVGAWGATRQYGISDRIIAVGSYVVLATPVFVLAASFKIWAIDFNNAVGHRVIEYTGEYDPGVSSAGGILVSRLQHLLLPSLTLIVIQVALYSRYQRSNMLDVLHSDFLRTARAKGLSRRSALIKHGLRTAVLPVIPLLVYNIALLFTGATFTEKIYGWHGMGEWLINSINTNDVNAVAAVGMFTAMVVLAAGLVSDLLYAALDPRVRVR